MLDIEPEVCNTDIITVQDASNQAFGADLIVPICPDEAFKHGGSRLGAGRPRIIGPRPWDVQGISRSTYDRRIKPLLPAQISYAEDRLRWYCVHTAYGAEKAVNKALVDAGFETLFPQEWVPPVAARRTEAGRAIQATSEHLVPLLQCYIFVRFLRSDNSWRKITKTRIKGVDRVLSSSSEWPTPIPDAQISNMRKQLGADDILYPERAVDAVAVKKEWVGLAEALSRLNVL